MILYVECHPQLFGLLGLRGREGEGEGGRGGREEEGGRRRGGGGRERGREGEREGGNEQERKQRPHRHTHLLHHEGEVGSIGIVRVVLAVVFSLRAAREHLGRVVVPGLLVTAWVLVVPASPLQGCRVVLAAALWGGGTRGARV